MPMPTMKLASEPEAERPAAEQPQRQQRVVAVSAARPAGSRRARPTADDVAEHASASSPSPSPALLGHDQQRHQADDQRDRARPVDAVVAAGVREVEHPGDDDQRERSPIGTLIRKTQRQPVMPRMLGLPGEEAADDRAEHAGRAEHGEEVALVPGPLAGRHDVADDRQRQREQAAGAEALDRAERGQLVHRRRRTRTGPSR